MASFDSFLSHGIPLKINMVVMQGKNTEDIAEMVALTKQYPVDVRFIEEMPFNGGDHAQEMASFHWTHKAILAAIKESYPEVHPSAAPKHSTANLYTIPGHQGQVGIIAAFSRTFCGSCNRIRLTAQGTLKTCLYDDGVLDLRQALRQGADDQSLRESLLHAFRHRAKDGFEAEEKRQQQNNISASMSTIGG